MENLVVVPATYEQWRKTHEHEWDFWGNGLTYEQYVTRERVLCEEAEFAKKAMSRWVLVPQDDPETLDIRASCESFTRPIYVKQAGEAQGTEATCQSVASVFTPKVHRKNGYAKRFMTLLHERLVEKGATLSVLYSDIGDFYALAKRGHGSAGKETGWEIVSPRSVEWSTERDAPSTVRNGAPVRPLSEAEFPSVLEYDRDLLRGEVDAMADSGFTVLPTPDQIAWAMERAKFYDNPELLPWRKAFPRLSSWGCQIGQHDNARAEEPYAFALWTYHLPSDERKAHDRELSILRLRCSSSDQLRAIIGYAQTVAREQGMRKITAWNVDERVLEGTGWQHAERTSSLPALAWYGPGERPETWHCNEHWAWC